MAGSTAMRYSVCAETGQAADRGQSGDFRLIEAANGLLQKAELAESTGGYQDWLLLLGEWRTRSASVLRTLYGTKELSREFTEITRTGDHGSARYSFPYAKSALELAIFWLGRLSERVDLAISDAPDAIALDSLHPQIRAKCCALFEGGAYAEAVEKGFKIVRDRLRTLTSYETGSDAFGRGHLYVDGSAAPNVEADFQDGVKFLTMAIDRFRNEKSHTADGHIDDPIRAYEYLRLSSLALHLLDGARATPSP